MERECWFLLTFAKPPKKIEFASGIHYDIKKCGPPAWERNQRRRVLKSLKKRNPSWLKPQQQTPTDWWSCEDWVVMNKYHQSTGQYGLEREAMRCDQQVLHASCYGGDEKSLQHKGTLGCSWKGVRRDTGKGVRWSKNSIEYCMWGKAFVKGLKGNRLKTLNSEEGGWWVCRFTSQELWPMKNAVKKTLKKSESQKKQTWKEKWTLWGRKHLSQKKGTEE